MSIARFSRPVVTFNQPLTLTAFSVDMLLDQSTNPVTPAVQNANKHIRTNPALPGHASNDPIIINALSVNGSPHTPQSLYVEFLWDVTGSEADAKFFCQVNLEEIGGSGPSKDKNVSSAAVNFVHLTGLYKDVVSIPIGTGAADLQPGLYTVTALLFVEVNGPTTGSRNKGLGAFLEVGKIMVA
ncbi:MAG: hypothetical protein KDC85_03985 [Saprospiraceae bacterium]|nr:hypothetical protein [Saprospiraceae bacterium]MCB9280595.1 hypothetical protein [Lewinellaceae bacterium]